MSGTNWNNPTLTSTYANFVTEAKARDVSAMTQMRSDLTADTNAPTGAIRWNQTNSNWETWSGTAWGALAATYGISISGNAANLSGTPALPNGTTATTQTAGDSTTKLATTAFVATSFAPLASPTFTGTPTLPTGTIATTQTPGDNTTKVATTAFVAALGALKADLASPAFTGTPSLPTGTTAVTQTAGNNTTAVATTAFVAALGALKANLDSPAFTGTPSLPTGTTAVTQSVGNNSTKVATTAFVLANAPSVASNRLASAWVDFDASSGTPTIQAQYNVTSITDGGVGIYTVNFTSALTSANYAVAATASFPSTPQGSPGMLDAGTKTSSALEVRCHNVLSGTLSYYDSANFSVIVHA